MRIIKIALLLLPVYCTAQITSGIVTYEDKQNLHKNLPAEMEAMKDRIPEYRTSEKVLTFTDTEAYYARKPRTEEDKKKNAEFTGERRRRGPGRRDRNRNNKFYTNFEENKSIDSRDLFGKTFLIEGEREAKAWKITADQKEVGDYLCQKAIYQDSTTNIEAWFTPMIPISSGPDDYFGLPGLILHLDIDEGTRTITATEIQAGGKEAITISKPEKGKKVTMEEFKSIREKKVKEMREEYGDRGPRRRGRGRN